MVKYMDCQVNPLSYWESKFKNYNHVLRECSWMEERYYKISNSFGAFFRNQKMKVESEHIDCIPNFWLIVALDIQGQVSFFHNRNYYQLWGKRIIYIPPFSIIKWKFHSESLCWWSYQGTSTPPQNLLPSKPIHFPVADFPLLYQAAEALSFISTHQKNAHIIDSTSYENSIAEKAKLFIDQYFTSNIQIKDVIAHCRCHTDYLTRSFKKSFGINPSVYLRDLRHYQAALNITGSSLPIHQIAKNNGIVNRENFSKSFRSVFRTSPTNFRQEQKVSAI